MSSPVLSRASVLTVFDSLDPPGTPVSVGELSSELDCAEPALFDVLADLVEAGELQTKTVESGDQLWWRPPGRHRQPTDSVAAPRLDISMFRQLFETGPELALVVEPDDYEVVEPDDYEVVEPDDYEVVEPDDYEVVEPDDYEVVEASDAYLEATAAERDHVVRRSLPVVIDAALEVGDPENLHRILASLDRVTTSRQADVLPAMRIRLPPNEFTDDEATERWWCLLCTPLFGPSGDIDYIVLRFEDVTAVVSYVRSEEGSDLLERFGLEEKYSPGNIAFRGRELYRAKEYAYDRLRESEERYRTLFQSIEQGYCIVEMLFDEHEEPVDYRFLLTNPAFEEESGLVDVEGKRMRELEPLHEEFWFEIYGEVALTGKSRRFTRQARYLDERWFDVYAVRVGDPDEHKVAILFEDVTDRKQTEAENRALRDQLATELSAMTRLHELTMRLVETDDVQEMLEEILDATIALQNADYGNVQLYDATHQTLTIAAQRGFPQEFLDHFAVVQTSDTSICGRALRGGERVVVEDVMADEAFRPHREVAASVPYRAVQSTPIVDSSGTLLGMLSTHFRNPHRPSERELKLTDLYIRLAAGLLERVERERELERNVERLDRFASVLSHDLRNPLGVAKTSLELAREDAPGAAENHDRIARALDRIDDLVSSLLTLAREGEMVSEYQTVELAAVAEDAWQSIDAPDATLVVEADDVTLECDPERLRTLFENLFRNSVEHGSTSEQTAENPGDSVEDGGSGVTIRVGVEDGLFFVADDGPGIPPEERDCVFEHGYSTTGDGTGFGLSIVESIAAAHDWEVSVEESEEGGARFEFAPRSEIE
ncbi:ATP-binding protein [Haloarchaeobius amylolyticus]|uniref:ATP-binding protein n=1 Tax=Haloarchaeobius amylolyticus TaxID=1198296 RepID=UPI002270BEFF|nr:ATP-binding protein [Haloarchaeobius amylolyticus]